MTSYTTDDYALPYPDGTDNVAVPEDVKALAVKAGMSLKGEASRIDGLEPHVPQLVDRSEYVQPFTDDTGAVSGGVTGEGRWKFEQPLDLPHGAISQQDLNADTGNVTSDTSHGWSHPLMDAAGNVAGGVRMDGTSQWPQQRFTASNAVEMANQEITLTRSRRDRIAAVGDSLTDGYASGEEWADAEAWPGRLGALLPGVTVFNRGLRGYTVDEISLAIGALPLDLTVEGGTIPASGPVNVSTAQVIGWLADNNRRFIPGSLAGVPGILEKYANGTDFTFTRDTDGTSSPASGLQRFAPEWDQHGRDTMIVFIGRNDINQGTTGTDGTAVEHVVKGTQRIVDYLSPQVKQIVLCGTITTTAETRGTVGFNEVTQVNARLNAAHPGKFVDVQQYLVEQCIYDLGITPTQADLDNMAAGTLPPSIMGEGDTTHFGKPAAEALATNLFYPYLTERGWV